MARKPSRLTGFARVTPTGETTAVERAVAVETPVAIELNGFGYAVLMATPADLADLARGFCLSERLIDTAADLVAIDPHETDDGILLRATLGAACAPRIAARVRHRVSESSCGLCGIENLEQALRPLPPLPAAPPIPDAAIFRAYAALADHQPLGAATAAVHVAAWADATGTIRLAREDVGRHNAFDKLIGAMLVTGVDWAGGFALLSSRCSYELVEKAVLARCPLLATVSLPTSLALARAASAGLSLAVLVRADALLRPSA